MPERKHDRPGRTGEVGVTGPFPGSRPLTAEECAGHQQISVGGWEFVSLSDRVKWVRCKCPWWHRLPFAGRFVHSELP